MIVELPKGKMHSGTGITFLGVNGLDAKFSIGKFNKRIPTNQEKLDLGNYNVKIIKCCDELAILSIKGKSE